ncbi:MAG: hypothetical protein ACK53L_08795, partial [Pirellulaceae bacterium]
GGRSHWAVRVWATWGGRSVEEQPAVIAPSEVGQSRWAERVGWWGPVVLQQRGRRGEGCRHLWRTR